jgi:hypothetical protein
MGNAAAPKITTRSFVFQHADSGNCQKPKSQTCMRTAGYHQESRQRRAGQFPVPIRTLGMSRHRVAYRGDNLPGGRAPMIKVNDEVKQLARTLADWAADKSVTVLCSAVASKAIIGRIATLMSSSNCGS